ncbi:DUF4446 family protein [Paenibacillus montanisoli]|uniref:DUF4446 domain-containing protein n=1 Tax=Paenibacillus montanisoli TaxID=2081970 RepID=A0A328U2Q4_9BACL|nr:DUF4446 family protein [Paenibacillus montanisoli]RAP74264.1 DUF4446 domain-containing protein [Paenibacillus montanisoli]
MDQLIDTPSDWVTAGLLLVVLILVVRSFVIGSKLKRLRKSYKQFMSGAGVEELESVIIDLKQRLAEQEEGQNKLKQSVRSLNDTLKKKKGNIGIHRYNAFAERGSDLSFSIAVIDDAEDGMVLSGIHGRENTFLYAKPVQEGQSKYPLTPEEIEAINLASQRGSK